MDAFHQYLHTAALDDPITEAVLYRARLLRRLGLRSEVYASRAPVELAHGIRAAAADDSPDTTPILFQVTGAAEEDFPFSAQRIVLTASALHDEARADAWLGSWRKALGTRVVGGLSERADDRLPSGWHVTPPMFDGSRASRRSPLLPNALTGRGVLLTAAGDRPEADRLVAIAAEALGQPIEVSVLPEQGLAHPAEVAGLFRRADAFLWGPAAPLAACLQALAFEIPVLAPTTPRTRQLLGDLTIATWSPATAAAALADVLADRVGRLTHVARQRARREALDRERLDALCATAADLRFDARRLTLPDGEAPRILIEGSFETSYSLDVTNRELARALERAMPGQVALFPTHGYGDYRPKDADLAHQPDLVKLWRRARPGRRPEVLMRGMYPPRVADMRGTLNILHFAWEESALPAAWAAEFNRRLDGLVVVSSFVRKVLVDAGVHVPIAVIGNGVDQALHTPRAAFPGELGRGFKLLHVSSAFPRKGVDLLLRAFGRAFDADDDVTLVLKTFPNPHHDVERDVAAFRKQAPRAAKVVLINRDLPPGQLIDLYHRCDALVAPSRGEGFGLPMAEAMALERPVITTGHGGVLDFAEPDSTWLIDYTFASAQSHMGLADSVWAEPDLADLARALKEVTTLPAAERRRRTARAKARVRRDHSWDRVAARFTAAIDSMATTGAARWPLRLGWVCPDGATAALDQALPKNRFAVTRCWAIPLDALERAIVGAECELAILDVPPSRLGVRAFGALLGRLRARRIGCVVMLPGADAALAESAPELAQAERVLVPQIADLNALKGLGVIHNVTLFPREASSATGARLSGMLQALRRPSPA